MSITLHEITALELTYWDFLMKFKTQYDNYGPIRTLTFLKDKHLKNISYIIHKIQNVCTKICKNQMRYILLHET
jgi:hypothetical protein